MVKLSSDKIEEVRDYFEEQSKREIAKAINDPDTEMKDDDIKAIKNKWQFVAEQEIKKLQNLSPKKMFKRDLTEGPRWMENGLYQSSYQKQLDKRRKAAKQARKSRKEQRKK